ncbi:hypothetical protein PVAP13_6KG096935 [Panicum virgatum]|uniref:Uncharacterized protein n=1 Tax=Panicum virgatum TaxID=38727 RepID=A0A8T0R917_PANVG|nr:hypothetical protein PVAP13_6KG096935 [Panicum virgatum]
MMIMPNKMLLLLMTVTVFWTWKRKKIRTTSASGVVG